MSDWRRLFLMVTFPLWISAHLLGLTLGVVWASFREGWRDGR